MNRLKKTDGRRGKSAPKIPAPSVQATATCGGGFAPSVQAAGPGASPAATHAQGGFGVPRDAGASPVGGWWSASSPTGVYPPGGFSNFLKANTFGNHPNGDENFHFVGGLMSQSSVSPPVLDGTATPSTALQSDELVHDLDVEEAETVNVDDDSRTDRRLNWSVPEDIRLASAWLHNSKDPIDGNEKKGDAYWADVTTEYNKTTETSRKRNRNQLKIRWDRSKKPLSDFHGCWVNASRVWQSGMSDDQLTDKTFI